MKLLDATSRVALGLVSLTICLILLLDLAFGLLPSELESSVEVRRRSSENLAVQVVSMLESKDRPTLLRTLELVRQRDAELESIGLRTLDGRLVANSGPHEQLWKEAAQGSASATKVMVPILADGARWGTLELAYQGGWQHGLLAWMRDGSFRFLLVFSLLCSAAFYLYLKRVLQHLDPSSAVPERVRVAFDSLTEGVLVTDSKGLVVLANESFRRSFKASDEQLIGKQPSALPALRQPDADANELPPWTVALQSGKAVKGDTIEVYFDGAERRKLVVNCAPVTDRRNEVRGCMITFDDITALDQAHEQMVEMLADLASSKEELEKKNTDLQWLATRDALTGCLNRGAFMSRFEDLFEQAQTGGRGVVCIMADIDHFKSINDRFGHAIGDEVIKVFSRMLSEAVRETDLVGRYGGEEFCIVITVSEVEPAAKLAERVRHRIEEKCGLAVYSDGQLRVTGSFGVSGTAGGALNVAELIEQADRALYAAKRTGRNRMVRFDALDVLDPAMQAQLESAT